MDLSKDEKLANDMREDDIKWIVDLLWWKANVDKIQGFEIAKEIVDYFEESWKHG